MEEVELVEMSNARSVKRLSILNRGDTHMSGLSTAGWIKCSVCKVLLTTKHNLKKHMKAKHAGDRVKDVHCEVCNKTFYSRTGQRTHVQRKHHKIGFVKCSVC